MCYFLSSSSGSEGPSGRGSRRSEPQPPATSHVLASVTSLCKRALVVPSSLRESSEVPTLKVLVAWRRPAWHLGAAHVHCLQDVKDANGFRSSVICELSDVLLHTNSRCRFQPWPSLALSLSLSLSFCLSLSSIPTYTHSLSSPSLVCFPTAADMTQRSCRNYFCAILCFSPQFPFF